MAVVYITKPIFPHAHTITSTMHASRGQCCRSLRRPPPLPAPATPLTEMQARIWIRNALAIETRSCIRVMRTMCFFGNALPLGHSTWHHVLPSAGCVRGDAGSITPDELLCDTRGGGTYAEVRAGSWLGRRDSAKGIATTDTFSRGSVGLWRSGWRASGPETPSYFFVDVYSVRIDRAPLSFIQPRAEIYIHSCFLSNNELRSAFLLHPSVTIVRFRARLNRPAYYRRPDQVGERGQAGGDRGTAQAEERF